MPLDESPLVLIAATKWWPLSARMAMALLRQGFRVAAASPPEHPLRFVRGIASHFAYGGIHSEKLLKSAIDQTAPYLVIPSDDGSVWQLQTLHDKYPELRPLIERSLGPAENYPLLRSRASLLQLAQQLGIRVPTTFSIGSAQDIPSDDRDYPMVLKVDGSCGGFGVEIVRSVEQAREAFVKLAEPVTRMKALKRLLVDSDPLPFWLRKERTNPCISLQAFVTGRPANAMLACWHGKLLAIVMVEVLSAQGETGAATVVRIIHNPEMELAARLLVEKLHLNGFLGLDFMLDTATGAAYLIELNPRPTQLGHLRLPQQGDLAGALAAALRGQAVEPSDVIAGDVIAFFPQAIKFNPAMPLLADSYHDLPEDQPELQRELLRTQWPDRRLLSRIYHFFWPAPAQKEARFS